MSTTEFDLDKYLRASKRVDLSGVEWGRIGEEALTEPEARCLTNMMDIESHKIVFLRDLLATRACFEPEVTAFLSCWVYEELWHGEAFSRFLGEAGHVIPPSYDAIDEDTDYPSRGDRQRWIRRRLGGKGYMSHAGTLLGSLAFRDFVSIHMTWGAVNELTTLGGYHRLIAKTEHPILVQMLQAIIKDERRHFAFYRAQARMRLARSGRARRITRFSLDHLWAPVGTGVRPQSETDFVVTHLFGDADGAVALKEMDATIAELPGLEETNLLTGAAREACGRLGVPFGM
ncbi:MAG: ferritin-like domain-containing protein [Actinomycetota bacterium]|nr:ferritin-like domain-containing protein [Actinomycetota bacterium]